MSRPSQEASKSTTAANQGAEKGQLFELKRNLSAYNIFFLLSRERLIDGIDEIETPAKQEDVRRICSEYKQRAKRAHRKTDGKYSFQTLSRIISSRWKALSKDLKTIYEEQAAIEKAAYKAKKKEFNKRYNLLVPQKNPLKTHNEKKRIANINEKGLDMEAPPSNTLPAQDDLVLHQDKKPRGQSPSTSSPIFQDFSSKGAMGRECTNSDIPIQSAAWPCHQHSSLRELLDEIELVSSNTMIHMSQLMYSETEYDRLCAPLNETELEELFDETE